MSQEKINIAIAGLGFGAEFIPIYQKHLNATMYAICQRTESKLNEIGNAFGHLFPIMRNNLLMHLKLANMSHALFPWLLQSRIVKKLWTSFSKLA